MIDIPQGIPSQIIDLAEKNFEQARGAFLGFIGAAQKATDAAETLPSSAKDAMAKAMSLPRVFLTVIVEKLAGLSRPEGLDKALQGCYTFRRRERRAWAAHVGLDPAW